MITEDSAAYLREVNPSVATWILAMRTVRI